MVISILNVVFCFYFDDFQIYENSERFAFFGVKKNHETARKLLGEEFITVACAGIKCRARLQ